LSADLFLIYSQLSEVIAKVMKNKSLSFPRKLESSKFNLFWTPVFTGVTGFWTFYGIIIIDGYDTVGLRGTKKAALLRFTTVRLK
jgi:hypothetical protein